MHRVSVYVPLLGGVFRLVLLYAPRVQISFVLVTSLYMLSLKLMSLLLFLPIPP
jgi:hypothetical protein